MAHTTRGTSLRRISVLRREVPSTVGLLADEEDFAAMARYRTFAFDNHTAYLQQIEGLLRTLTDQGVHTTVALFDPDEFAAYCAETGLDPDSPASRSRFTADIAAHGATVMYAGQPLDSLIPHLVNEAVRKATWEYATMLLAGLGDCADCGRDIGRAAFDRASRLLVHLIDSAGPGLHHLVVSVPMETENDQILAVLHAERDGDGRLRTEESEAAEFATVLAAGIALESAGGLVLRTSTPDAPDRLRGWRLRQALLEPLTAAEVFSAYCTDAETGDPLAPEPDVDYCAGYALDQLDNHDHNH